MKGDKWITLLFTVFWSNSVNGGNPFTIFPPAIRPSISNNSTDDLFKLLQDGGNPMAEGMRIKAYTGNTIELATVADIPISAVEAIYQQIDPTKPLVIYAHGFREHPSNESIRTVVGAYLERGTENIFILDWSDLAFDNYFKVFTRVKVVAEVLAKTFDALVDRGLDVETFHYVGHSLGAQIGGFFGRYSKYSIPRITGLDPANPGFYHTGADHIGPDSARLVDIIHTDGGFYGALEDTGTVDFYANGGSRAQPGCVFLGVPLTPSDLCNHWRSWRYYAETVKYNYAFPATQCESFSHYKSGECDQNRKVFYGYSVPKDARGSYYFTTNSQTPFGNNLGYINWNILNTV